MGIAILSVMQTFFYEDLAYTNFLIGLLFAGFGAGMLIGGVGFGMLGDRLKVQTVLILTTILYMVLILSVLVLPIWVFEVALPLFLAVGIITGGYEATQLRIGMENSPGILSGTVFNLYASISKIGQIAIGGILIGLIASFTNFSIGWQLA